MPLVNACADISCKCKVIRLVIVPLFASILYVSEEKKALVSLSMYTESHKLLLVAKVRSTVSLCNGQYILL